MGTDCRLGGSLRCASDRAAAAAFWEEAEDWEVGLLDRTVQSAEDWMEKSTDSWILESLNCLDLESTAGSVSKIANDLENADVRVAVGEHAKSAAVGREGSLADWESPVGCEQSWAEVEQSSAG